MSAIAPPLFEGKKLSPKRCLFGRPSKQKLEHALSVQENNLNKINDDARRFRECWGFDPVLGKPVQGGLYECVPASGDIPSVYLKGYARRKISPVLVKRDRTSPIDFRDFHLSRSQCVRSVKRKLPLDFEEDVNDENTNISPIVSDNSRVQVPTIDAIVPPTPSSSVESSPMSDSSSSYPSPTSLQELHHRTPRQHQSQIQDFFQIKKQKTRCNHTHKQSST